MPRSTYRVAPNASSTKGTFPILVLDRERRLHVPLTLFAKEAPSQVDDRTARKYLASILPFFEVLDREHEQGAARTWDVEPHEVRIAVVDYLNRHYACKVRQHRLGFQLVSPTAGTRSTVHVLLAGLRLYYHIACSRELYAFPNPLQDHTALASAAAEARGEGPDGPPRMPEISGVVAPRARVRLTDSYFRLQGGEWRPQIIDDPTLPARVFAGGRSLKGWGLREDCITHILFESGARVSEVLGLTLGDWARRNLLQEATCFSKGSHGRRVKFLRFAATTAKLVRRYVDTDRRRLDARGYGVAEHLRAAEAGDEDLLDVPFFLSTRRRRLSPQTYRQHYWNPACAAAGIDADVHQARHWYVTMAIREIYETARDAAQLQRRKRELIEYMGWRSGEQILAGELGPEKVEGVLAQTLCPLGRGGAGPSSSTMHPPRERVGSRKEVLSAHLPPRQDGIRRGLRVGGQHHNLKPRMQHIQAVCALHHAPHYIGNGVEAD